jgi:hypothetical protein
MERIGLLSPIEIVIDQQKPTYRYRFSKSEGKKWFLWTSSSSVFMQPQVPDRSSC